MVMPIALPGIVTGIALMASIKLLALNPSFWTVVLGHITFCIVTIYNNVFARLKRMPASQIEALVVRDAERAADQRRLPGQHRRLDQ